MKWLLKHVLYFVCLLQISTVWAEQQAYPIITYTCDKKQNVLKIKNEVKWGDEGRDFAFSVDEGTYNPWSWVDIEDRGDRQLVRQSRSIELNCELLGEVYRVVLEPKLFNPDFNGQCGNKLSTKVSIYNKQAVLLDKKDLESFCKGNAKIIRGIKIQGNSSQVELFSIAKHKFY